MIPGESAFFPDAFERQGFHNGAVWRAPNGVECVLQYMGDDRWVLLAAPTPSVFRGTFVMLPYYDLTRGREFYRLRELPDRLAGWTHCLELTVKLVDVDPEALAARGW